MKKVNYWRVPFKFFGCHEFGHVQAQCRRISISFPLFQKKWKLKFSISEVSGGKWTKNGNVGTSNENHPCQNPKSLFSSSNYPIHLFGLKKSRR